MMSKWSDDSACWVVHNVRLYSVLDTVVISGEDVCCSVMFGTLVVVLVLCGPSCWYAVLYVCVCCFVVRGCAFSRRYIDVCDMFSVVNVYLDHLKFCVMCINGWRYVCCGKYYVCLWLVWWAHLLPCATYRCALL